MTDEKKIVRGGGDGPIKVPPFPERCACVTLEKHRALATIGDLLNERTKLKEDHAREVARLRALLQRTLDYLRIPVENDDAELRALKRAIPKALREPED